MSDAAFADYFDGTRALRQRAEIRVWQGNLHIALPDGEAVIWPSAAIRQLRDQPGGGLTAYGRTGAEDRLVADAEAAALIDAQAPSAARGLPGPPLAIRAAGVFVAGCAAIAALIWIVLPALASLLAEVMDPEAEVALGELHFEQTRVMFGGTTPLAICDAPAGQAALEAMVARVGADLDLPYPIVATVLDDREDPILNAYAVAGGRVTFFHSMIVAAEHPDEIAAVLAHEIGHVVHDDPVRGMLQQLSGLAVISVLLGDITGGGLLSGATSGAIFAGYSRDAETRADIFAARQLRARGLPPSALGRMFERLRERYGDVEGFASHFASHPQLAERILAASGAGDPPPGAPSLSPKAWSDLRAICR